MASAALAPYSDPSVQCRSYLPRVQSPSSEVSAKCSAGGCLRARGWLTTPTTRGVLSTRRAPAGSAPGSKATSRSGARKTHTPSSTVRFIRTWRALLQADAGLSASPPPVAVCGRCCKAPPVVRKLQERKLTLDVTGLSPRRNRGLYGRGARPKWLIGGGWPELGAACGMTWCPHSLRIATSWPKPVRRCFRIGLSGKPLYTKKADSFSAAVSASSGDALATASGARAERQRQSGRGR